MTVDHVEAAMCADVIAADPSTWLHARIHDWQHPLTREGIWLANVYDSLESKRLGRKFKPSPKPWPKPGTERLGRTTLGPEESRALLRRNRAGLNV